MIALLAVVILVICFLFAKFTCGKTKSPTFLLGKTAIVTGGNSGIGYQVCLYLASRGCKVIIADRDNSEKSVQNIIKLTNNPNIISKYVDLANFESVKTFAEDIIKSEDELHFLVHNAAIAYADQIKTEDGFNPIIQIGYLSPFLLTHLLLGLLKKSSPSRVIFTSSLLASLSCLDTDFKRFHKSQMTIFDDLAAYCDSKLATIIAANAFAQKLTNSGVTFNSVHPGLLTTMMFKNFFRNFNILLYYEHLLILAIYGKDDWEGAQTTIHAVVAKELETVTGRYFVDCIDFYQPSLTNDKELCQKLWKTSEELVNLPGDLKI